MIRLFIRKLLQRFNYDIVKYHPTYKTGNLDSAEILNEYKWLQKLNIKTVLDIGANEGQFSEKARTIFKDAAIYAFEPLPVAFEVLKKNFASDNKFFPINLAAGEREETVEINLNESSASSSILPMTDTHTDNFSFAVKTKPVTVKVNTLDAVLKPHELQKPVLMKIDVQGFEDKVLAGAKGVIKNVDVIIIELSFKELYANQPLFDDIYNLLKQEGFKFCGSLEQLRSPNDNEILQADGIFMR